MQLFFHFLAVKLVRLFGRISWFLLLVTAAVIFQEKFQGIVEMKVFSAGAA